MKYVFESFLYETFNKCKQGSEILASRSISRTQVNIYDGVFFTEIVNGMKAVNVSQKSSIVDIPLGSKHASGQLFYFRAE